ncbi:MAG: 23S rRNA pseudouridine synthase F, partial [Clostridia bacterium]|nr:23S rRNA pseudouridine synthase F [Clostridia bacterium]
MRINKYIADSGLCSRREADTYVSEGKVRLNGKKAKMGDRVMEGDSVSVNGKEIGRKREKHVYIALNKPAGIVCTADTREEANVVDFVDHPRRVFPIGRLDKDSEGLLLLTTDGDIVNRLLRAEYKHEKEYVVTVNRPLTQEFLRHMASGVEILDTKTLPCKIRQS